MLMKKNSFMRNAMAGVADTVVRRPPWEIIAIVALGVAALANIMLFAQKKMDQKAGQ